MTLFDKKFIRNSLIAATTAIAIASSSGLVMADSYKIDDPATGAHASINFRTKHLGFSWLTGRFNAFSGTIEFDEKAPEKSSVMVEIDVKSIDTNFEKRDGHLRGSEFFDVEKFPTASFKSTAIEVSGDGAGKITGDLTLHGTTKAVVLDVKKVGGGKDPWGGVRQGFTASTTIVPAEYGMAHAIAKQPVELEIEVEAIKQ